MESRINELIDNSKSILLLTHERPDGDAIGSVLAFYHYLSSINKTVDMVILDIPKVFNFLPSINKVVDNTSLEYDLGICLDCATNERIGQKVDLISKCKKIINIDHHINNTNYGDINYVKGEISSCCQVVYYLFKEWNVSLDKKIGEAIITGVLTDTNGFGNNNVDSDTFNIASDMIKLGVNVHGIYQKILCLKTLPQYELMKIGIDRLELLFDGKIAFTYVLDKDFKEVRACVGDHEGIVDIGRSICGVEVSIFLREDDGWLFSLRSTGTVDVGKIAMNLGGGGHRMAAGGKINSTFEETKNIIINEIKKVIFD